MSGIKSAGYTWEKEIDSYDSKYICQVDAKFTAMTWKFGSIHQCKVFVQYAHKIDGEEYVAPGFNDQVGIGLTPGKTRAEAMQRAIDWIEKYKKKGPFSAEKMLKKSFKNYPDLFFDRIAILDHWFFTIGNGYDWLDGSLIELSPSSHIEGKQLRKETEAMNKIISDMKKNREEIHLLLGREFEEEDDYDSYKIKLRGSEKISFYPVSKDYSNICCVPDDIKPEWLKLAYEAAKLLRDRSGVPDIKSKHNVIREDDILRQEENKKIGQEIVKKLERRFPDGIKKIQ